MKMEYQLTVADYRKAVRFRHSPRSLRMKILIVVALAVLIGCLAMVTTRPMGTLAVDNSRPLAQLVPLTRA